MSEGKVDLATGKIYNCEPNTLSWYHEEGHIIFNNTDKGVAMNYRADFFMRMCVLLLVVIQIPTFNNFGIRFIMGTFVCLWLYYYFYEEVWCWKYAFQKRRDEKTRSSSHSVKLE